MKLPIGTKIRFTENCKMHSKAKQDVGKIGTIVSEIDSGFVKIYIPDSVNNDTLSNFSWITEWENCVPINQSGKQLLFPFMS